MRLLGNSIKSIASIGYNSVTSKLEITVGAVTPWCAVCEWTGSEGHKDLIKLIKCFLLVISFYFNSIL